MDVAYQCSPLTLTTGKPFLGSDGQLSAIEVKKGRSPLAIKE